LNVQTAIAAADDIAASVAKLVTTYRSLGQAGSRCMDRCGAGDSRYPERGGHSQLLDRRRRRPRLHASRPSSRGRRGTCRRAARHAELILP
jgi:hypothetical protein